MELLGRLAEATADPWTAARHLPLTELPAFQNDVAPYWQDWLRHPVYDESWERVDALARADDIGAPLLQIAAWYDNFLRGHLDLNARLRDQGDHRLVVGPWDHEAYLSLGLSRAGQRDFGPSAIGGPTLWPSWR
jgi:predicted acyl esterase